jgi:hypothetical protein
MRFFPTVAAFVGAPLGRGDNGDPVNNGNW